MMRKSLIFKLALLTPLLFVFFAQNSGAESLNLMRRWVVFPFDSDTPNLKNAAETAWWKSREKLTQQKKYLVASRQFLIQRDVFQPRKNLNTEDVKLLSHLLDADVVVTGFNEGREFQLNVYLAQNGLLYWSKRIAFHPGLKASDQLEVIAEKLTQEALNQVPYQGFVITDPIIGKTIFEEDGSKKQVVVDMGTTEDIQEGMEVQWVKVNLPEPSDVKEGEPLLKQSKIEVIADGKVAKIKKGVVTAQIERAKSIDLLKEKTFAVFPKLANRVGDSYLGAEVAKEKDSPEALPTMINPVAPESEGAHKSTLVFGTVISLVGLLLLGL